METHVVSHNVPGPLNVKESLESAAYSSWASLIVADGESPIYINNKTSIDFTGIGSGYTSKMLFYYSVSMIGTGLFLSLLLRLKDISVF